MTTAYTDASGSGGESGTAAEERAFHELTERHRREIHVHCYRMLGSFEDAEDLTQETLLRAWKARDRVDLSDPAGVRAWLYRIATNACLDSLKSANRRLVSLHSFAEVPWLQPYPDRLLDELTSDTAEPDAVAVARETVELAFIAMGQLLPPRQRAVMLLRDVLEWSAADTASALGLSVAAANSALQRARTTMREHAAGRDAQSMPELDPQQRAQLEKELLDGFIDTHQRADAEAALELMHEDIRVTMPPQPMTYDGRDTMTPLLERAFGDEAYGEWRLVPTSCNRMPAAISYVRQPGDTEFRAFKVDVLRIADGKIREVTTFGVDLREQFGVPAVLPHD